MHKPPPHQEKIFKKAQSLTKNKPLGLLSECDGIQYGFHTQDIFQY